MHNYIYQIARYPVKYGCNGSVNKAVVIVLHDFF